MPCMPGTCHRSGWSASFFEARFFRAVHPMLAYQLTRGRPFPNLQSTKGVQKRTTCAPSRQECPHPQKRLSISKDPPRYIHYYANALMGLGYKTSARTTCPRCPDLPPNHAVRPPGQGVGGYYVADKRNPRRKVLKLHGDKALINGVHAYRRMPVDCDGGTRCGARGVAVGLNFKRREGIQ